MIKNGMRPIHPGEILQEEFLVPLGMTATALARALHMTPARVSAIVRQKRGISAETALRLSRYFGGDAQSWLNLQQAYDLKVAQETALDKIMTEVQPRTPGNEKAGLPLAA